ncbi:hypothetical protein ACFPN2_18855 [Steroidobacter flavus]|uniref:Uncharacterized protein n=1 Tax=Steroidobacter flavus TaxID=1842136 RepID=A0ABV8SVH4_9GAMM
MNEIPFSESKNANDDRFLAQCARAGHAPEIVYLALQKATAQAALTPEEEALIVDYADAIHSLPGAERAIVEAGVIDLSGHEDKMAYCTELIRSVRRKQALRRVELLTDEEKIADRVVFDWIQVAAHSQQSRLVGETLAVKAMPSVLALSESTFDEAFGDYVAPMIVYFHGSDFFGEPKASGRVERLAREVGEFARVARVNLMLNPSLADRFRVRAETLMIFSASSGRLEEIMESGEPYLAIAARVEPYVSHWRRMMTDPQRRARIELVRQHAGAAKDAARLRA